MSTKASLTGVKEVQQVFDRVPNEIKGGLRKVVNAMLTPYIRAERTALAVVKRTGLLSKAVTKKVKSYADSVWGGVGISSATAGQLKGKPVRPSKYAHLVELGTKPHEIHPRGYGRSILHPGTKPYPFRAQAVAAAQAEAIRIGETKTDELIKKSLKGQK